MEPSPHPVVSTPFKCADDENGDLCRGQTRGFSGAFGLVGSGKMMKRSYEIGHVLMTADAASGAWTQAIELARGLARHGVRTSLATMGAALTVAQRDEAKSIAGLELYTSEYRTEWMNEPWEDVDAAGCWLLALAERVRPDVVHLHSYAHAALPWLVPTIVTAHGDLVSRWHATHAGETPEAFKEYVRRVGCGLRCAGVVVAPTAAMLNDLQRHFGPFPAGRVVAPGRNYPELAPARKRHMVLSVGSAGDESKNLTALQRVSGQIEWPVYLAGDLGNDRQPRTHGINFLGRLCSAALGAWYSRAGIFVLPAKYDATGISVQEAAICGCALVLGDIPSLRELWDGAAIFVDPSDEAALAKAIRTLEDDSDLRQELSDLAMARAKAMNSATMVCDYLFAYQDLRQGVQLDLEVYLHPAVSLM